LDMKLNTNPMNMNSTLPMSSLLASSGTMNPYEELLRKLKSEQAGR
jgi:hypothetical protein